MNLSIGNKIKALRKEHGITQEQLADRPSANGKTILPSLISLWFPFWQVISISPLMNSLILT